MARKKILAVLAGAAVLLTGASVADATPPAHWVGTWASVPTQTPATATPTLADETIRQVVHTSVAGSEVRLRLTNEFGTTALRVGAVHVARRAGSTGTAIDPRTDRTVTFGGVGSPTIPSGAPLLSDPVRLPVPARADLVVSIYLPGPTPVTSLHNFAYQENVVARGDVTDDRAVAGRTVTAWYFLSSVSVRTTDRHATAVVAFGDSITNGAESAVNANHRWPDLLANRLRGRGMLNLGVAGNRLLHDPNPPPGSDAVNYAAFFGESAMRRFDRDVLAQPGAEHVIVLLGVNDLGHPGTSAPVTEAVTAEEIINAHRQLIVRAHAAGLEIIGGTILPFKNDTFGFYSPENEAKRQAVNHWIRTGGEYDGFVDFDAALRDPADPRQLRATYDSGDHLHPNDAGMAAMAAAIPLNLLR
ncbi:SGNH/GDSL hydrolase family protein [Actinophytocola algeriensis]|uniref:Lysophospholipase L1-like esterase n=1 Tax=Actinophytocola algeriensis TaxID=1768010 RepID=A0A7W7VGQ3_9PSEU|nr:SGNH/GDSL hydrolase family protein [Actinophytocola algeriensis]MBB4909601.1 lysophospholipase L1-like esterase [Actinophytocola algeriensis]MBE1475591.1 lysophospholipase L1-like esterase [Actinophytocola algeriensis]